MSDLKAGDKLYRVVVYAPGSTSVKLQVATVTAFPTQGLLLIWEGCSSRRGLLNQVESMSVDKLVEGDSLSWHLTEQDAKREFLAGIITRQETELRQYRTELGML